MTSPDTLTIVRVAPGRDNLSETMTADEKRIVRQHVKYLQSLRDEGIVLHAGRTTDPARLWGVIVMKASETRAADLMKQDPAVRAGLQVFEAYPYAVVIERDRVTL